MDMKTRFFIDEDGHEDGDGDMKKTGMKKMNIDT